jgi:hypothetical protein
MDFWNIVIEVGPSSKPGTKNPRHHQRGAYDGRRFGLQNHLDGDMIILGRFVLRYWGIIKGNRGLLSMRMRVVG